MSATYRIEAEHMPGEAFPWYARIYKLSDDYLPCFTKHGDSQDEVVARCRSWVAEQNEKQEPVTLLVDDFGQDAEHSVKA